MRTRKARIRPAYTVESYEVHYTEIKCDSCGALIEGIDGCQDTGTVPGAELSFGFRRESFSSEEDNWKRRRRDYCDSCLVPVWEKLCEVTGSDPVPRDPDYGADDD
jgi:hypothetical protein